MKFTIEDVAEKTTYILNEERFCKKLASFLTLYERHKTDEEIDMIFARCKLAIKSNAIFMYQSYGFKFMAVPERRTL